ncbi:PREDICTED: CASP-like protein 4A3 [Nicotiana attenuata]|uniref:CASP-like protein n=1 Tax=Nicotiana attenuata TaxID=49451 RepID=A0A1J6IXW6_NICAT|nr:PREDICTED: CASP-like protein 4A3 [Nicotiana attenuata]OIT02543.1 casp-like protein 4a3 [Nicotiana attenuata]
MKPIMKNSNSEHNSNSSHRNLQKHNSHISMSDTESQVSQIDSFHSPLRSNSPLRSDDPFTEPHPPKSPSKAIVKYFSPLRSPHKPSSENLSLPPTPPSERRSPVVYFSRAIREDAAPGVTKVGPVRGADVEAGEVGGERRSRAAVASITGRSQRDVLLNRAALGFRVCEVIFCLISFSVMAADKTQGWTGDSFDRYKEYRYCVAVNVIGFAYSGFQAFDLAYSLATGKHFLSDHMRYHFDFLMDQILAYLLMSASSSAATRVDDWISNWGKDEFTEMASASIALSFLAFIAFAFSSLISGYSLCNRSSS